MRAPDPRQSAEGADKRRKVLARLERPDEQDIPLPRQSVPPTKRLVTMADVVDATVFLLENPAMNGQNLYVDGGWMLM